MNLALSSEALIVAFEVSFLIVFIDADDKKYVTKTATPNYDMPEYYDEYQYDDDHGYDNDNNGGDDENFITGTETPTPGRRQTVIYGQLLVGGIPAIAGEFPYMAALGWFNGSGDLNYHCGGMIISPYMVLTAAHCVYKDGKIPDIVFVGGGDLSEKKNLTYNFKLSKFSVGNVTIYPDYNPNQGYDDIAILELSKDRKWFPHSVCLWTNPNLPSDDVTAIGYGLTEFAGRGSQELLKVNLTIFSSDYCDPYYKRQRKFKMGLSDALICAGDKEGIKDTCQGDSGGPIIIRHTNQMFAVGITSSGQACSGSPPAIYTKIYPYIKWIKGVLKERGEFLKTCD